MAIQFPYSLDASEDAFTLSPGNHKTREDGLCAMEAAAWLAGEPHSDQPRCTTEVIAAYVRHLNDHMPDDIRPRLIAYLPRIIGIPEDDHDYLRNEVFARHAVQVFAPAALRREGYESYARSLERQHRFRKASYIATIMVSRFGDTGSDMTPIQWAVYRAGEAARTADCFANSRDMPFRGATPMTPPGACAAAAAGCAFQAWRVGCENIWELALSALDEVLLIRQ